MVLKKTNEIDQIINRFENAIQNAGKIMPDNVNDEEMLFRSSDGRFYFSIKDG